MAGTAFALSPAFSGIKSSLKGLDQEVDCSQYENDKEKKQKCEKCKNEVKQQKKSADGAVKKAEAEDQRLESQATSEASKAAKVGAAQATKFDGDKANKGAGSAAKSGQASNFANLAQALNKCKDAIESACEGIPEGDNAKNACESAAAQAQAASAQSAADADKMAKDEKKNDENGKGMEPPKMPEMPKQEEKPKAEAPKSDVTTPEKVAGSSLSGNQLAGNKVGIGGTDDKTAESKTGVFNPGTGASFDSGISSAKPEMFTGAPAGSGESRNSSGSSSMGSLGAGGGGEGGAAGPAALAPALAKASEDLEGYSNGSSRPSFLGMKSKGSDSLADLGLDAGAPLDSTLGGAEPTRDLATTDQNAGIHTEDSGSIFTMVRSRIKEIGRRGAI